MASGTHIHTRAATSQALPRSQASGTGGAPRAPSSCTRIHPAPGKRLLPPSSSRDGGKRLRVSGQSQLAGALGFAPERGNLADPLAWGARAGVRWGTSPRAMALQVLPALERSSGWRWEEGEATAVSLAAGAERPALLSAETSPMESVWGYFYYYLLPLHRSWCIVRRHFENPLAGSRILYAAPGRGRSVLRELLMHKTTSVSPAQHKRSEFPLQGGRKTMVSQSPPYAFPARADPG